MEGFDDERTGASAARVVVLGSVNIDSFVYLERLPQPGETVFGTAGRRGLGGKGANQAVAAALMGAQTELIAQVGADDDGAFVRDALRVHGVGVSALRVSPGSGTGSARITVEASGENTIVVVSGANADLGPDVVTAPETTVLLDGHNGDGHNGDGHSGDGHNGAVALTQGESPAATVEAFARACAARGVRFVLNLAPVIELAPDVLRLADPLIVNETEALALEGRAGRGEPFGPAEACDTAARLAATVAASVVITLGAAGAVAATRERAWAQPAPAPDVVVDTTGAGDAFVGALVATLAGGATLEAAVSSGVAAGTAAVSAPGTVESYQALRALRLRST